MRTNGRPHHPAEPVGGVALLLWGTHMVQSAILQGLRRRSSAAPSASAAGSPLRAAATGAAAATALQSATATAMLRHLLRRAAA